MKTFICPPGTYFFGDPCYAIEDDALWTQVCDAFYTGDTSNNADGILTDGTFFVACNTMHGDGVYTGSDGYDYGVDAGLLGVVSLVEGQYDEAELKRLGTIRQFVTPFSVQHNPESGEITLADVYINTDWSYEEDEE